MLLGNTYVKEAVFMLLREITKSRSARHGGGYCADFVVLLGKLAKSLAELGGEPLVARHGLTRINVELTDTVELARLVLGGSVALALFGYNVDQSGRVVFSCRLKCVFKLLNVVTVDWT